MKLFTIIVVLFALSGCETLGAGPTHGRYMSIEDFHCAEEYTPYCKRRGVDTAFCECVTRDEANRRMAFDREWNAHRDPNTGE